MTGLVIDTSTQRLLLGLTSSSGDLKLYQQLSQGNHAGDIIDRIHHLVDGQKVDAIGVARGPGSFTGLRIGLAVAKGLAEGWECSIFGLDSLLAMAKTFQELYPDSEFAVLSVIDARKSRFYGSLMRGDEVLIPASDLGAADWLVRIGERWSGPVAVSGYQGDLLAEQWTRVPPLWQVRPIVDWTVALAKQLRGLSLETPLRPDEGPHYLRLSEAEVVRLSRLPDSGAQPDPAG